MQNCKQEEEKEEKVDNDVPCTLINYTWTFCALSQAFLI
jgi:hypothetical protein